MQTNFEVVLDSSSLAHWQPGRSLRITGRPFCQTMTVPNNARSAKIASPPLGDHLIDSAPISPASLPPSAPETYQPIYAQINSLKQQTQKLRQGSV